MPPFNTNQPWLQHYDANVPQHLDYPHIPLYRLLDDAAERTPTTRCATFFGKGYSYRSLKDASDHFAAALQEQGVTKGDRVALLLPNSPQFIIAYYGILKAGAVIVPLNPLYTERELTFHLSDSGAETVVTIPMFLEKVAGLLPQTTVKRVIYARLADFLPFPMGLASGLKERGEIKAGKAAPLVNLTDLLKQPLPAGWQAEPVDPDDMAVLIYSGGTTGVAKGIM
ncbi:MAG: AMP-binding protein, partial [Anaerolineae bacterium]|nr:AMP-binding protein [Anaerolineae bacterium]